MTAASTRTEHSAGDGADAAAGEPAVPEPARGARGGFLVLAALVVPLVTALHLFVARDAVAPVWLDDEIGYLANAHWLAGSLNAGWMAGDGVPMQMSAIGYYAGWSVLLTPLWWVADDPATVYRLAVGMSVVCGVLIIAPFHALARRCGLSAAWSLVAAGIIAAAPGRAMLSGYTLAENFLALIVAVVALLAWRYVERPTVPAAALLGATVAYAFFTHGRVVPLVPATLLLFAATARRAPRAAAVGTAVCLPLSAAGFVLNDHIISAVYVSITDREGSALGALLRVDPVAAGTALIGQAWYQVAAWAGLSLLGVALLLGRGWAEIRERRPGVALWALASTAGVLAISVSAVASAIERGSVRVEIYTYGRYLEPLVASLALVGLARLMAVRLRGAAFATALSGVLAAVLLLWLVVPQVPAGRLSPINVPGLMAWPWAGAVTPPALEQPWVRVTLVGTALMLAVLLVQRSRAVVATLLAVAAAVSTVVAQTGPMDTFDSPWHDQPHVLADTIEDLGIGEISYDLTGSEAVGRNGYQLWLAGRSLLDFTSDTGPPPTDAVLARRDWPAGQALGARRVAGDPRFNEALWIMPGALQERIEDRGALETDPVSLPLPPEARAYDLDVEGLDGISVIDRSDPPEIGLTIRHEGKGATWAAVFSTTDPAGCVRILLWWQHAGGQSLQLADLPRSLIPGASTGLRLRLEPPPDVPDGPASIRAALHQEGVGELAGPQPGFLEVNVRGTKQTEEEAP